MLTISGKTDGSRKLVFPYWGKLKKLTVLGDGSWRWLPVLFGKITQGGYHFY
jgi:hypothetical protein